MCKCGYLPYEHGHPPSYNDLAFLKSLDTEMPPTREEVKENYNSIMGSIYQKIVLIFAPLGLIILFLAAVAAFCKI